MKPFQYFKIYLVTLFVFLLFDFFWLGFAAKDFYQNQIGFLMSSEINLWAAGIFYFLYPVGLIIFALIPAIRNKSWQNAFILGGIFGLFCYATYDLTNLATLANWPILVVFVDIIWGFMVSSFSSLISYKLISKFNF